MSAPRPRALVCLLLLTSPCVAASGRCAARLAAGGDVQHAVDALPRGAVPHTVCLGAGAFVVSRSLSIDRDGVRLRGDGRRTVLRLADRVQRAVVVVGDHRHEIPSHPTSNVTIERMRIVGGGRGGPETDPERPYLTNSAIVVRAGRNVALRDLHVSGCRSACIVTERDTRDVAIERSTIVGSTWDGISLNRTTRARVVGNDVHGNTAAGMTVEHLEDGLVEGNAFARNGSHGVYLADSHRNRFLANRFTRNVDAGVFLTCAVRLRDPGPVACWPDSMSRDNAFARNLFAGNRRGYVVAADAAANCTKRDVAANVSREDRFVDQPGVEQRADEYGPCLAVVRARGRVTAPRGAARAPRRRTPM